MKYLSETMTREEAGSAFHKLAKKLHPDVGGDEEEFKILADEYARIRHKRVLPPVVDLNDLMAAMAPVMEDVAATIAEIYPRTRVQLYYSLGAVDVEISGNVPVSKMLHIEELVSTGAPGFAVTVLFQREGIKKWISLQTRGTTTYINTSPGADLPTGNEVVTYQGTRYTLLKTRYMEYCIDKKSQHVYVAKRMPKLPLKELLGI